MESQSGKNGKKIVLSESTYAKVGDILKDLLTKTRAKAAVFADMDGYPIVYRGRTAHIQIPALTALAAGSFSATAEIAKIIGEKDRFRFLYHEGERSNIYLCTVGDSHIIFVTFDSSVALGMIRIFTNLAVNKLSELLGDIQKESKEAAEFLDLEFQSLLSEELDKSFKLH